MAKILLAEDDRDLAEVITFALKAKSYLVQAVNDGIAASEAMNFSKFDLFILDWMLPGMSGIDLCREHRSKGGKTPILMLTAKTKIEDRELGLDSGADDYLIKPFDQKELFARVRALLRRPDTLVGNILIADNIQINTLTCAVTVDGNEIHLRPKEYSLLEFFLRHPNQVFSSDALLQRVWLDESSPSLDNLKTHIKMLRRKIDKPGVDSIIKNVKGRGYVIETKETAVNASLPE